MYLKQIVNCLKNFRYKNKKLAIIILGKPDTGKSTLLKELVKHSINNNGKEVVQANKGTRRFFFNDDKSLTQDAYVIFSSLSEDREFLDCNELSLNGLIDKKSKDTFNNLNVLIYPDHPDTEIYKRNKAF